MSISQMKIGNKIIKNTTMFCNQNEVNQKQKNIIQYETSIFRSQITSKIENSIWQIYTFNESQAIAGLLELLHNKTHYSID